MWSDVARPLREAYLADNALPPPMARSNGKGIDQLNAVTGEVVTSFVSTQAAINFIKASRQTLERAIREGSLLRGSRWRKA